jgi:hypothetical protein
VSRAGDGHRLGLRFFPELDTLTVQEYHRLNPAEPAAPLVAERRTRSCDACGRLFAPNRLAARHRFCCRRCRVWFHMGAGSAARKAAS